MLNKYFSQGLLFFTALIWGSAFVAQKIGAESLPPFAFNGIRFIMGVLFLGTVYYFWGKKVNLFGKLNIVYGMTGGFFLLCGATLQQIGIRYTTTGKTGFITGLYVVLVPMIGIFTGQRARKEVWLGCSLAFFGLYFLSMTSYDGDINFGDFLVFCSSIFFAFHVTSVDIFLRRVEPLEFCLVQYSFCAIFSLVLSLFLESFTIKAVGECIFPLLYGGIMSVGIAYTLQIVGQKNVGPSSAAIILSFETMFAALGGFLILGEIITYREFIGCVFMLTGIIVAQIRFSCKR